VARVPAEIVERFECICFHMADVSYGRGGSPLQNLILRGHHSTVLTALRIIDELDAGPTYLKKPLSLEGCAQDIYERAANITCDLMLRSLPRSPLRYRKVASPSCFVAACLKRV
jgi:methionyl-tRNA formyltransferase